MSLKSAICRWFGRAEKPVTPESSVLFVLQHASPRYRTLGEIQTATKIPYAELRRTMDDLRVLGRVVSAQDAGDQGAVTRYWIVR